MAANPCDELIVDLSRVDVDVEISGPPCIDVDWLQTDITIEAVTVANQGPKGDKGDPGEDGESIVGPSGPPGTPGIAASVDAGTTTTGAPGSAANVVNSGTSSTAIFDFLIPRGDVGATGPQGQGIEIKGTVANHAALPTTGNQPGDVWITLDTNHGWSWNGTAWIDIGPMQGPKGDVGPSGPAGSDGATGAAGAAATATAGTTTTGAPGTAANVVNTGTSSAAVFAFTIPRGDVGATGAAGTPGGAGSPGAPGVAGGNAWTLVTNASFTVPAYGANVTVQAGDTSWVALGEWVYVDDAGGPGVAGQLVVTSKTPTTLTLFNPTATTYPLASTSADGLLRKVSGLTSDFVDGTNNYQAIVPQITSVRLRSYNSVQNPNFEVNQRAPGSGFSNPVTGTWPLDRWLYNKSALTGTFNVGQAPGPNLVPGTNYRITNNYLSLTLTGQQASLAAGDYLELVHNVEGPQMREMIGDVHSLSLLVSCTVPLKFSVVLYDASFTWSLAKLCTIPVGGVPTLIQLPNIPVWTPSGTFNTAPGSLGYQMRIGLCSGSTYIPAANDVWGTTGGVGAIGMDNFASKPVNTVFSLSFVQHEPGSLCTTLMDKPFAGANGNLDECLRYYQKTYDYGVAVGTATAAGAISCIALAGQSPYGWIGFQRTLAKAPTMTVYSSQNGTLGSVWDAYASVNRGGNNINGLGTKGYQGVNLVTPNAAQSVDMWHHTADTGW